MDENTAPHVVPELARAQLESAAAAQVGSDRDRSIHGIATVGFGLLWGGYLTYLDYVDSLGLLAALVVASVLAAGAMYLWRERTGTTPRHTTRAVNLGWVMSIAVVVILPFLSLPADQPLLDLITAGLIAAPIVLAGFGILLRR